MPGQRTMVRFVWLTLATSAAWRRRSIWPTGAHATIVSPQESAGAGGPISPASGAAAGAAAPAEAALALPQAASLERQWIQKERSEDISSTAILTSCGRERVREDFDCQLAGGGRASRLRQDVARRTCSAGAAGGAREPAPAAAEGAGRRRARALCLAGSQSSCGAAAAAAERASAPRKRGRLSAASGPSTSFR